MIWQLLEWLNLTNGWASLFALYKAGIVISIPKAFHAADSMWRDEVSERGYSHLKLLLFTPCATIGMVVALIIWPIGMYGPFTKRKIK